MRIKAVGFHLLLDYSSKQIIPGKQNCLDVSIVIIFLEYKQALVMAS